MAMRTSDIDVSPFEKLSLLDRRLNRSRSVNRATAEVAELVRITHDIDRDDFAVLDLQRGGLQDAVLLHRDKPRQAVDEAVAHDLRHVRGENRGQSGMEFQDRLDAYNRPRR